MFFYAQFNQSVSSVERMLYNVDEETFEGPFKSLNSDKYDKTKGIEVNNIYTKYRSNLPFVLKGLSLNIEPKEKVALVGRTGSGKSTFLLALTRILNVQNSVNFDQIREYQQIPKEELYHNFIFFKFFIKIIITKSPRNIIQNGYIKIGGIQIDELGLHDLRKKMSVIPQDSFVFSGSLKFNIDPFKEHSDDEIYSILQKIKFFDTLKKASSSDLDSPIGKKEKTKQRVETQNIKLSQFNTNENNQLIQNSPKTFNEPVPTELLNWKIEDGGSNLSIGQKQLICIARALIKQPEILLMDEATSNIDEYTDALIQKVIKEEFVNTTIGKNIDFIIN
jgi:ABC-type multidrug transport system fused ATPase/permease subunit